MIATKQGGKCVLPLIAMIVALTLSSCNATPEKAIVQNKNASNLMDLIKNSKPGASGIRALAGKHVKETYRNQTGTVAIELDADIALPKADKIPAAEAMPRMLGQEDLKRLLGALVGSEPLYEMDGRLTKDEIRQIILDMKKSKAEDEKKTAPPASGNGAVPMPQDQVDSIIAEYEAMLADAPDELTYQPADYTEVGDGKDYYFMAQTKPINNVYKTISIMSNSIVGSEVYFYNPLFILHTAKRTYEKKPEGLKLSAEQAVIQAKKLIDDIGMDGMEVTSVIADECVVHYDDFYIYDKSKKIPYYQVVFTRTVNNIPSNYDYRYTIESSNKTEGQHAPASPYETAFVFLNDDGLLSFEWYCPMEITQMMNNDIGIMDFQQIMEIAKKQITVENAFFDNQEIDAVSAQIDTIQLGLMRIKEPNKQGKFLIVPVWDFMGRYKYHYTVNYPSWSAMDADNWLTMDNVAQSILTINAIDGTIIDRNLGY